MADGEAAAKKSDLGVRVTSAIVMVAVAGTALWLGGWTWTAFMLLVALGVLWEWWGLVRRFVSAFVARLGWMAGGLGYVAMAALSLMELRQSGLLATLAILLVVIAIDTGAYFAGRAIGGPKIAPKISPSKTWAGLFGGILSASLVLWLMNAATCDSFDRPPPAFFDCLFDRPLEDFAMSLLAGSIVAIVAQAGDFFESWMKRRAGVKDSGNLIPGHGGLFDRVDGLLAVLFVLGVVGLMSDL